MSRYQHLQQLDFNLGLDEVDHLDHHGHELHVRVSTQFNLLNAYFHSVFRDDLYTFCASVTTVHFFNKLRVLLRLYIGYQKY